MIIAFIETPGVHSVYADRVILMGDCLCSFHPPFSKDSLTYSIQDLHSARLKERGNDAFMTWCLLVVDLICTPNLNTI